MDRQVSRINKSDGRDLWARWFSQGREDYRKGSDINEFPAKQSRNCIREWIAGWNEEHEKQNNKK